MSSCVYLRPFMRFLVDYPNPKNLFDFVQAIISLKSHIQGMSYQMYRPTNIHPNLLTHYNKLPSRNIKTFASIAPKRKKELP